MRRALAFLTVVGGGDRTPNAGSIVWFPLVGAAIGLVVGFVWWGAERLWPVPVAAALAVSADLALTGMLHLDGLADSADGLLPHLPRARRLEVMAEPTIGAFGVGTVAVVLLLRFAAFSSAPAAPLAIAGLWCASRTLMAVVTCRISYARPAGLASSFRGADAMPVALLGGALAGALAAVGAGTLGLVAVGGVLAGGVLVVALGVRRLGGFTGDVLGAAGLVGETVGLLLLSVTR